MTVTKKGYSLANDLGPYVGWTSGIAETCSLLTRHATSYDTIQERWCNEEMVERTIAALEKREAQIEKRIRDLAERLPQPDDGCWTVRFDGDPRNYTVALIAPDGRTIGVDGR